MSSSAVLDTKFCDGLTDGFSKMIEAKEIGGFYGGSMSICFRCLIPWPSLRYRVKLSMSSTAVWERSLQTMVQVQSLGLVLVGVMVGAATVIISHPADTLLSKTNKDVLKAGWPSV